MLHIVTPLYLTEYLEKIWYSINADQDITWHIAKTKTLQLPDYSFLKTDRRIKIYEVDCEESETHKKRNAIFEKINNGYFCLLDDDTVFHENMYIKYRIAKDENFRGMLIGKQLMPDGSVRLEPHKPEHLYIDSGNVLCYHSPLSQVKWPETHKNGVNNKDSIFWEEVYEFFNKECFFTNEPISIYNKLSGKLNNLFTYEVFLDKNGKPKKIQNFNKSKI